MHIIDLTPAYRATYLACLKDWEADPVLMEHKGRWHDGMVDKGLRVKLALNDAGQAAGMVQYLPIEHSRALGHDLTFIQCIWVTGYDEGIGNMQGRGYGRALLAAAEADALDLGTQGIAAWGMDFPHWFPVSWYEAHGYTRADQQGPQVLVWKPFTDAAEAPRWVPWQQAPTPAPGKVRVTAFVPGWCPTGLENARIAREAVAGFDGDTVELQLIDTSDRATLLAWGIDQGIFIDDAPFSPYGPPFGVPELRDAIQQKLTSREDVHD